MHLHVLRPRDEAIIATLVAPVAPVEVPEVEVSDDMKGSRILPDSDAPAFPVLAVVTTF